jgi:hypothetical protein
MMAGPVPLCGMLAGHADVGTKTSPLSTFVHVVFTCVTGSTVVPSVQGATGVAAKLFAGGYVQVVVMKLPSVPGAQLATGVAVGYGPAGLVLHVMRNVGPREVVHDPGSIATGGVVVDPAQVTVT